MSEVVTWLALAAVVLAFPVVYELCVMLLIVFLKWLDEKGF